jgi:EAL domain-containing protein (putative c-di-GMP-specific phosphodiesterase class I)
VVTGIQFDLVMVAAILTIIGYSTNDKVVVYDRVRENLRKYKSMPLRDLIDLSINETLNRTLGTSSTVFLASLPLALFGGETLSGFAWAMLFGIAIGTVSSIMIAAPNVFDRNLPGDTTARSRLLLVSADPELVDAAGTAARHLFAWLEVMPTLDSALAWLLHPSPTSTHVLAPADLPPGDIDALAGMVDEVTGGRARLFLLGRKRHPGPLDGEERGITLIDPCDAAGIERVLTQHPPAGLPARPDLSVADLRAALHDGRLRVRFQPVLHVRTLRLLGVEALSRLHHPTLGVLRPSQFMPQAIASGQERALSSMAAARAVIDLRGQAFMQGRYIAFNVPLPTFLNEVGPSRALEICAIAALPAERVVIELVETRQSPDLHCVGDAVERWREAGFNATIDDAGPGLPHWRDMLELPFNGVKLDGSLALPSESAIRQAEEIVAVAKGRGKFVVAEGIEDAAAAERMRSMGVDALQGFFFCRPVPARALRIWSEAWQTDT